MKLRAHTPPQVCQWCGKRHRGDCDRAPYVGRRDSDGHVWTADEVEHAYAVMEREAERTPEFDPR